MDADQTEAEKLRCRRERERARCAAETAQEREERLRKHRLRDTEQRQVTLDCMRDCQHQRLSSETDQKRETRLQRLRDIQNRRLSRDRGTERGHAAADEGLSQSDVNFSKTCTGAAIHPPV